jgi:hypothetical protein
MIVLAAGALAFCAPVWSDVRIPGGASGSERMCYCDCEAKASSPVCMHMCELPKYENRSWASSCHKKEESEPELPSSKPGAHSTKNNSAQEARR